MQNQIQQTNEGNIIYQVREVNGIHKLFVVDIELTDSSDNWLSRFKAKWSEFFVRTNPTGAIPFFNLSQVS